MRLLKLAQLCILRMRGDENRKNAARPSTKETAPTPTPTREGYILLAVREWKNLYSTRITSLMYPSTNILYLQTANNTFHKQTLWVEGWCETRWWLQLAAASSSNHPLRSTCINPHHSPNTHNSPVFKRTGRFLYFFSWSSFFF